MSTFQQTSSLRRLDSLVPYWRNPRRMPDAAVNALASSIEEYGYNQPIVVDSESVIIIGHTRYSALRRLGIEEAEVMTLTDLAPDLVKQLRVLDNRAGEYSTWNIDLLITELQDSDSDLMKALFPEANAEEILQDEPGWTKKMADAQTEFEGRSADVEFVCPSCFHTWTTLVGRDEVLSGKIGNDRATA